MYHDRVVTDVVVGASLISSYLWYDLVIEAGQGLLVIGGVVIMLMRGYIMWQEIREIERKKEKEDGE